MYGLVNRKGASNIKECFLRRKDFISDKIKAIYNCHEYK